jgi:glutathione synthase
VGRRDWAKRSAVIFARLCLESGVIVLNDPNGLAKAETKLYLEQFPEQIRPRTLISRHREQIREFAARHGTAVLKPLQGSGGQNVFIVRPDGLANLNQMIDAVSRDGYVIAQEYLPEAAEGDIRLFMMNGQPLRYKGKYCAFRRTASGKDVRSNVHAGGSVQRAELDRRAFEVAEIVRPKLVEDGMFLVGLDLVGDKLMEINVFTPGGLGNAQKLEGVNFGLAVVQALERKVQYAQFYSRKFNNVAMATL